MSYDQLAFVKSIHREREVMMEAGLQLGLTMEQMFDIETVKLTDWEVFKGYYDNSHAPYSQSRITAHNQAVRAYHSHHDYNWQHSHAIPKFVDMDQSQAKLMVCKWHVTSRNMGKSMTEWVAERFKHDSFTDRTWMTVLNAIRVLYPADPHLKDIEAIVGL